MQRIRTILFPTRFDELSFQCVEALYPFRAAGLEEILLLFVVDREEVAFVPYGGFNRKLSDELTATARIRFEDWGKEIQQAGLRFRSFVEMGRPAPKILEVAAREGVDLIVTGRQRRVPVDAVYLGGTAMEILRRSPVPVLVHRHAEAEHETVPNAYERVLYPTDFSEDARPAGDFLKVLRGLAQQVDVVHVIGERDFARMTPEEVRGEEQRRTPLVKAVCGELETEGFVVDSHLRAGDVDREIVAAARDYRSTLIVMGTTEKEGLREFWYGSVSHRVAELSEIPVILVPARKTSP